MNILFYFFNIASYTQDPDGIISFSVMKTDGTKSYNHSTKWALTSFCSAAVDSITLHQQSKKRFIANLQSVLPVIKRYIFFNKVSLKILTIEKPPGNWE